LPSQKKCQNIYIKAQFESPKHLHQTTFEIKTYLQQTQFSSTYYCAKMYFWANLYLKKIPQAFKSCPIDKKSRNPVTLVGKMGIFKHGRTSGLFVEHLSQT